MNHRHLLPEEIDLLLDNEEGFGVAPLRNHLESCPSCVAQYEALARVVGRLESLPLIAPAPRFAERVMTQVNVFEPWHVALRDTVTRFAPSSTTGKAVFGVVGSTMAVAMTLVAVWLGRRADAVLFLTNLAFERMREGLYSLVTQAALAVFGDGAAAALRSGGTAAALAAAAGLGVAVVGVAFGVKAVATAGRSRRV